MATSTRREPLDLMTLLQTRLQSFTFGQALRVLAFLNARDAESKSSFLKDEVHVRPWLSLGFPACELSSYVKEDGSPRNRLTASIFGLYSTLGPLPTFYTEELIEADRQDENISRDFLDILNNHLYHLLYEANQHNSLELMTLENLDQGMAHIQLCLQGYFAGRGKSAFPKPAFLEFFSYASRSAQMLESYLYLLLDGHDVSVEQCVERFGKIPERQRCLLGFGNARLGEDAVIGQGVRDFTGKIHIHVYGVQAEEVGSFSLTASSGRQLRNDVSHFVNTVLEVDLLLHLVEDSLPLSRLGVDARVGAYLGGSTPTAPLRIFWGQVGGGL